MFCVDINIHTDGIGRENLGVGVNGYIVNTPQDVERIFKILWEQANKFLKLNIDPSLGDLDKGATLGDNGLYPIIAVIFLLMDFGKAIEHGVVVFFIECLFKVNLC